MRARVNKEGCISCGMCVSISPDVFKFDNAGKAEAADDIPDRSIENVKEARDCCPAGVIDVFE